MGFSRWEKLWSRQRGKKLTPVSSSVPPPKSFQQIEWGNQLYQQGAFSPLLSRGRGQGGWGAWWYASPEYLKFQSPRTKECVFHSEYVAFIKLLKYQSQSIPTRNKQGVKTKLHTFARSQILRKPIKKLGKN